MISLNYSSWNIQMRFLCAFLLTLILSTIAQTHEAKAGLEDSVDRGLAVVGVTALSAPVGGVAGFFIGGAIGDKIGGGNLFYPLAYGTLGGIVSAATAAPLGALVVANYVGANKGVVTINTAIVAGLGAAYTISGIVELNEEFIFGGLGAILVGAPLTAGVTAGLFPSDDLYTLAPVISPTFQGLAFHSRF
jgi:hypothetical protein